MGCHEMTSKRYISNGFCTSVRPVTERVCTGYCLPRDVLPWYSEYVEVWSRSKLNNWRCVERRRRTRTVRLRCDNGVIRRYPLRVVSGCRCEQASRRASAGVVTGRQVASSRRARRQRHWHRSSRRQPLESSTDST